MRFKGKVGLVEMVRLVEAQTSESWFTFKVSVGNRAVGMQLKSVRRRKRRRRRGKRRRREGGRRS